MTENFQEVLASLRVSIVQDLRHLFRDALSLDRDDDGVILSSTSSASMQETYLALVPEDLGEGNSVPTQDSSSRTTQEKDAKGDKSPTRP